MPFRALAVVAASTFTLCALADEPATIKIGELLDRSGSIATPSWFTSVALAVREMNAALERAGRQDVRFALVGADSRNSPVVARAKAVELVRSQGAKALITDSTQDDIAVHSLVNDKDPENRIQVPVICMACTSPQINSASATDPDPLVETTLRNTDGFNFRTSLSDRYQAQVVVRWLQGLGKDGDVNGDGVFKVGIYASDDRYGHGFSDAIKALVIANGKRAAVEQIYHPV